MPRFPTSEPTPSGPSAYAPVAAQMPATVASPADVKRRTQNRPPSDRYKTPEKPEARDVGGVATGYAAMPHAVIVFAVTSAADGAHVVTLLLGEIMRKRLSKTYTFEAASEARKDVAVKVAAAPTPSSKPATPLPATVETAFGNQIEPGVVGATNDCVYEYVAPPSDAENENDVVDGAIAFADVAEVTT